MPHVEPISQRPTSKASGCSPVFVVLLCGLIGAAGLLAGWFITGRPLLRMWSSQSWPAARCEVVSSQVGSSGDTFFIDIKYQYAADGRTRTSHRYDFNTGTDSARASKEATVAEYPPGRIFDCFVNPENADDAVIDRGFRWGYLWGLLFVVLFTGIPAVVAGFSLVSMRRANRLAIGGASPLPGVPQMGAFQSGGVSSVRSLPDDVPSGGAVTLKPSAGPVGRFLLVLALCLFWNGIVGVFTYVEVTGGLGDAHWFLILFLIPFQLIGLTLVFGVFHSLLAMANPRPTVTLSSAAAALGSTIYADWRLKGAAGRISKLTFSLEGREEATYRQGTDTKTDNHVFHQSVLMETTDRQQIAAGNLAISIPADSMHTFTASRNRIVWELKLHGSIARWPDVDESFEIQVRPR